MYQALPQHQQRIMDPEAEYVTNPTDHLIKSKKLVAKLSIGIFCIISASVNYIHRSKSNHTKVQFNLQVVWGQLDRSIDEEVDKGQSFKFLISTSILEIIILWIFLKLEQGCENGSFHWKCQNLLLVLIILFVEGPSLYFLGAASHYTSGFPSKFFLQYQP